MHSARAYMQALQIIKDKSWTLAEVSGIDTVFIITYSFHHPPYINVPGVSFTVYVYYQCIYTLLRFVVKQLWVSILLTMYIYLFCSKYFFQGLHQLQLGQALIQYEETCRGQASF